MYSRSRFDPARPQASTIFSVLMRGLMLDEVVVAFPAPSPSPSGLSPARCSPGSRKATCWSPRNSTACSARRSTPCRQTVEALKARGVKLHLIDIGGDVSGNGISGLFFTIVSAFAQFERERIRERIGAAKADQKARKRFLGGHKPVGFKVTDDGEQPSARRSEAPRPVIWETDFYGLLMTKAGALEALGREAEALDWVRRSLALSPANPIALRHGIALLEILGRDDEAREAYRRYSALPGTQVRTIAELRACAAVASCAVSERAIEALRKAGMPEQ